MTLWSRLLYAATFAAVAEAISILSLGISSPDTMEVFLHNTYWLVWVYLAVAFALAPALSRYIRRK